MRPKNKDGTEWSVETSNMAFANIRAKALDDLHDYEERVSGGRLNAENQWCPLVAQDKSDGSGTLNVPDPVLASLKSSGDDQQTLVNARWAKFCNEPQDETPFRKGLDVTARTDLIVERSAAGESIEEALAAPLLPSPLSEIDDDKPPRRGAGRPKGSKNRPKAGTPQVAEVT